MRTRRAREEEGKKLQAQKTGSEGEREREKEDKEEGNQRSESGEILWIVGAAPTSSSGSTSVAIFLSPSASVFPGSSMAAIAVSVSSREGSGAEKRCSTYSTCSTNRQTLACCAPCAVSRNTFQVPRVETQNHACSSYLVGYAHVGVSILRARLAWGTRGRVKHRLRQESMSVSYRDAQYASSRV